MVLDVTSAAATATYSSDGALGSRSPEQPDSRTSLEGVKGDGQGQGRRRRRRTNDSNHQQEDVSDAAAAREGSAPCPGHSASSPQVQPIVLGVTVAAGTDSPSSDGALRSPLSCPDQEADYEIHDDEWGDAEWEDGRVEVVSVLHVDSPPTQVGSQTSEVGVVVAPQCQGEAASSSDDDASLAASEWEDGRLEVVSVLHVDSATTRGGSQTSQVGGVVLQSQLEAASADDDGASLPSGTPTSTEDVDLSWA